MTLEALNVEDQRKIKTLFESGVRVLGEIKDLRESLRDTVKAHAEELDLDVKKLNQALKLAFKEHQTAGAIDSQKEINEDVDELLHIVGLNH